MGLPEQEKEILDFWEEENIFEKSLEKNKDKENFVFYDGPITVNARPGIHHVLARIFKDIIPRFKTMNGYFVERKNGWDTHGLPVELEVEKNLDFETKKEIEDYGIEKFNKKCKENVKKYLPVFKKLTKRIGYWVDMEAGYTTYKPDYMETEWWILKQIWDRDLLYQDRKVVPYCPRCGTSLSSHEVAQGYEEITEPAVYIKFQISNTKLQLPKNTYLLAWTTTPWTLPGNVGLAVDNNLNYVMIETKNSQEHLILAKEKLSEIEADYEIISEFKGEKLTGTEYEPLYQINQIEKNKNYDNAYRVYEADFIKAEEGTGIVHTASMYGEEDYKLGKEKGLPEVHTITKEGKFKTNLGKREFLKELEGEFVKDADPKITKNLKERNLLYKQEPYSHEYPFCWRCGTPLLYYAKNSWFIKMTELREELLENNEDINWTPEHLKEGRFGEWLRDVKDWALSRDRFWGTPLPIWECSSCDHSTCIGSVEELKEKATNFEEVFRHYDQKNLPDLHRPQIDEVTLKCDQCGEKMERVPYVADVWFDSGSMPFAQQHYPFEKKKAVDNNELFPADYISEAIDQTRGWFYTLLAISTLLEKGTPYKNVLCLGLIFDEEGQEMSKSKGNIVHPFDQIQKHGADPIRWFFYVTNSPDKAKKYNEKELKNHKQRLFYTLGNSLRFLKMYAPDNLKLNQAPENPDNILNQWLLSRLNKTINSTTNHLDNLELTKAARELEDFIDELSNWYIRNSRGRFQNPNSKKELEESSKALGAALSTFVHLLAPFVPFYAESKFQELKEKFELDNPKKSIHLENWPQSNQSMVNSKLEGKMKKTKRINSLALKQRRKAEIKVRQPLPSMEVRGAKLGKDFQNLLKRELNVKEIKFNPGGELKVKLDTKLSQELIDEGDAREIIRGIQALRKDEGLTPEDKIEIQIGKKELKQRLQDWLEPIEEQTKAEKIKFTSPNSVKQQSNSKKIKLKETKTRIAIQET